MVTILLTQKSHDEIGYLEMTQRTTVQIAERWDTDSLYSSWEDWECDVSLAQKQAEELTSFQEYIGGSAEALVKVLSSYFACQRTIDKALTYAHLRQDEDLRDDHNKAYYQRATTLCQKFEENTAWLQPALLSLPEQVLQDYIDDPTLRDYSFYLARVVRQKQHTLSTREEEMLSMASKALQASSSAFGMLENADFTFDPVVDKEGREFPLTLGNYLVHQMSTDRSQRKQAFQHLHYRFNEYGNTICELLNGQVQNHLFESRARNFPTCMEAALFPHQIDPLVYHNLISGVRAKIGVLHRYLDLRCRALGLDKCSPYDLAVTLTEEPDKKIPYEEAERLVLASCAPLGDDYVSELARGLGEQRWVDRYENIGKRSGAYSSGCYDSHPYILMNYNGSHRDVSTLMHEAGHSMHSLRSNRTQPYHYSNYPIFVAEVASTLNEELLFRHLLERIQTPQERNALVNRRIDDIRATLFRQTLFAEFELWIHQLAEEGVPLTPSALKNKYLKLNAEYYGTKLELDPLLAIEWARIPHFYYNFYVYQYATGISAALYLAERILQGDGAAKQAYLDFLASGYSDYPLELLAKAGVSMRSQAPVEAAIDRFAQLIEELEKGLSL